MRLVRLLTVLAVTLFFLLSPVEAFADLTSNRFVEAIPSVSGRTVHVSASKVSSAAPSRSVKRSSSPVSSPRLDGVSRLVSCGRPGLPQCVDGGVVDQPPILTLSLGVPEWQGHAPVDVGSVARRAALSLELPAVGPKVGPDPSVNEWNMAVVGHPLWLWVDSSRSVSSSVTEQGIRVSLSARLDRVVFDMGDGGSVSCSRFESYQRSVKPGTPSPSCGYVYQQASLPKGSYRVEATAYWVVSWSALGRSGVVDVPVSGGRDLPVGELQAVIVR